MRWHLCAAPATEARFPYEGPYRLCYGNKYLQVSANKIRGVDEESSASTFWLETTSSEDEFKITTDQGCSYITSGKSSVQVSQKKNPLIFTFADAKTISDWVQHGSRLVVTAPDGYLGYNEKQDLVEIFPSNAEDQTGEVSLLSKAKYS